MKNKMSVKIAEVTIKNFIFKYMYMYLLSFPQVK